MEVSHVIVGKITTIFTHPIRLVPCWLARILAGCTISLLSQAALADAAPDDLRVECQNELGDCSLFTYERDDGALGLNTFCQCNDDTAVGSEGSFPSDVEPNLASLADLCDKRLASDCIGRYREVNSCRSDCGSCTIDAREDYNNPGIVHRTVESTAVSGTSYFYDDSGTTKYTREELWTQCNLELDSCPDDALSSGASGLPAQPDESHYVACTSFWGSCTIGVDELEQGSCACDSGLRFRMDPTAIAGKSAGELVSVCATRLQICEDQVLEEDHGDDESSDPAEDWLERLDCSLVSPDTSQGIWLGALIGAGALGRRRQRNKPSDKKG